MSCRLDFSVLCILEHQRCVHWLLPIPGSYGIRRAFPCKSAIGSGACRAGLINCVPAAKLETCEIRAIVRGQFKLQTPLPMQHVFHWTILYLTRPGYFCANIWKLHNSVAPIKYSSLRKGVTSYLGSSQSRDDAGSGLYSTASGGCSKRVEFNYAEIAVVVARRNAASLASGQKDISHSSAGFLGDLPFPPTPSFQRRSILASVTLIGSQEIAVRNTAWPLQLSNSLWPPDSGQQAKCNDFVTGFGEERFGGGGDTSGSLTRSNDDVVNGVGVRTLVAGGRRSKVHRRVGVANKLQHSRQSEALNMISRLSASALYMTSERNQRVDGSLPQSQVVRKSFLWDLPFPPALAFRRCSILASLHLNRLPSAGQLSPLRCTAETVKLPGLHIIPYSVDRPRQIGYIILGGKNSNFANNMHFVYLNTWTFYTDFTHVTCVSRSAIFAVYLCEHRRPRCYSGQTTRLQTRRSVFDYRSWILVRGSRAGRCVFSRGSPVFPRSGIPTLLHTHLTSPTSAHKTSMLRATQMYSLYALHCSVCMVFLVVADVPDTAGLYMIYLETSGEPQFPSRYGYTGHKVQFSYSASIFKVHSHLRPCACFVDRFSVVRD
ncbi:hypothetical protein PR048_003754 [Dryococelus australis]|uniref:Uncharacterized protein n=1 Tax=Dryococelus australis TaxID=614101 RepID=A0ABQ9INX9_9NEOP|nr:hypothetical protein PR048_003754 [Dryococelus australis]